MAEILVEEGDRVERDQLLIRLDAEQLGSELAVIEGQLLEVLARRARLEAEEADADALTFDAFLLESENPVAAELREGSESLFRAKLETAEREIEQLRRQQDQIRDQIAGIEAQEAAVAHSGSLAGEDRVTDAALDAAGVIRCDDLDELMEAAELIAGCPELRAIANCAVGTDNVEIAAATARKIPVGNTPEVLTDSTADLAVALMLAISRRLCEGEHAVHAGEWLTWEPAWLLGRDLNGAAVGIVGGGRIGRAVAERLAGFG